MSQDMKNLIRNVIALIIIAVLAYAFSMMFGEFHFSIFPESGGGGSFLPDNTVNFIVGLPMAFIFFLTLLFTAFGAKNKYWWIGILLIPATLVEIYLDFAHIYIPIALALIGWLLGFTISKFIKLMWQY